MNNRRNRNYTGDMLDRHYTMGDMLDRWRKAGEDEPTIKKLERKKRQKEQKIERLNDEVAFINTFNPATIADWVLANPDIMQQFIDENEEYRQSQLKKLEDEITEIEKKQKDIVAEEL